MASLQLVQHSQYNISYRAGYQFYNLPQLLNESKALYYRIEQMIPHYGLEYYGKTVEQNCVRGEHNASRTAASLYQELNKLAIKQYETNHYLANQLNLQFEYLGNKRDEPLLKQQSFYEDDLIAKYPAQPTKNSSMSQHLRYQKQSSPDRLYSYYDQLLSESMGQHMANAKVGVGNLNNFDLELLKQQKNIGTDVLPYNPYVCNVSTATQLVKEASNKSENSYITYPQAYKQREFVQPQLISKNMNLEANASAHYQDILTRIEKMQRSFHKDKTTGEHPQKRHSDSFYYQEFVFTEMSLGKPADFANDERNVSMDKSYDDYGDKPTEVYTVYSMPEAHKSVYHTPQYNQRSNLQIQPKQQSSDCIIPKPQLAHRYSLQQRADDTILAETTLYYTAARYISMKNRPSTATRTISHVSATSFRQPPQTAATSVLAPYNLSSLEAEVQYNMHKNRPARQISNPGSRILPRHEEIAPLQKSPLNRTSSPRILKSRAGQSVASAVYRSTVSSKASLNIYALRDSLMTVNESYPLQYSERSMRRASRVDESASRSNVSGCSVALQTEIIEKKVENLERMAKLRKPPGVGAESGSLSCATLKVDKQMQASTLENPKIQPTILTSHRDTSKVVPFVPTNEAIKVFSGSSSSNVPELHARKNSSHPAAQDSVYSPNLLNFEIDEQKTPVALNEASMLKSQKLSTNDQPHPFNAYIGDSVYQNKIFLDYDSITQYKMDLDWDE